MQVEQSLQLNSALDFNMQKLSQEVEESIEANRHLEGKIDQLASKFDSAVAAILAKIGD